MDSIPVSRKVQIADLMILTIAVAALLAMGRYYWTMPIQITPVFPSPNELRMDPTYQPLNLDTLAITGSILLSAFSPALLWISLRRPRPSAFQILRRPGTVASLVGTVFAWKSIIWVAFHDWRHGWPSTFRVPAMVGTEMRTGTIDLLPSAIFPWLRHAVGPWMIGALVVMLIVGRWRGPAGWVEWSGRCLGAAWILLYLTTLR